MSSASKLPSPVSFIPPALAWGHQLPDQVRIQHIHPGNSSGHGRLDGLSLIRHVSHQLALPVRDFPPFTVQTPTTLTLRPRQIHEAAAAAHAEQETGTWRARYALRAGTEGTINQALDVTGIRRARYHGLPKVRLQHAFSATALNVVRLDAYWSDQPLGHARTSRLDQLAHKLAA